MRDNRTRQPPATGNQMLENLEERLGPVRPRSRSAPSGTHPLNRSSKQTEPSIRIGFHPLNFVAPEQ
jgi:hypothetical protein